MGTTRSGRSRLHAVALTLATYYPDCEVGIVYPEPPGPAAFCRRPRGNAYCWACLPIGDETFIRVADESGLRAALALLAEAEAELVYAIAQDGVAAVPPNAVQAEIVDA